MARNVANFWIIMALRSCNIGRHEATFHTSILVLFCLWDKSYNIEIGEWKGHMYMFPLGSVIDVYGIAHTLLLRKVAILNFHNTWKAHQNWGKRDQNQSKNTSYKRNWSPPPLPSHPPLTLLDYLHRLLFQHIHFCQSIYTELCNRHAGGGGVEGGAICVYKIQFLSRHCISRGFLPSE